jgi:hypothetical protein
MASLARLTAALRGVKIGRAASERQIIDEALAKSPIYTNAELTTKRPGMTPA